MSNTNIGSNFDDFLAEQGLLDGATALAEARASGVTVKGYPVLIEPGSETTAWGVIVPELPGCFSAGDTREEALEAAGEAVDAWLEASSRTD